MVAAFAEPQPKQPIRKPAPLPFPPREPLPFPEPAPPPAARACVEEAARLCTEQLRRYAYWKLDSSARYLGTDPRELAADLAAQAIAAAWEKATRPWGDFPTTMPEVRAWLYAAVRNEIEGYFHRRAMIHRTHGRQTSADVWESDGEPREFAAEPTILPEGQTDEERFSDDTQALLASLTRGYGDYGPRGGHGAEAARCFVLYAVEEWEIDTLADHFGWTMESTNEQLHYARKHLRAVARGAELPAPPPQPRMKPPAAPPPPVSPGMKTRESLVLPECPPSPKREPGESPADFNARYREEIVAYNRLRREEVRRARGAGRGW